MKVGQPSTRQKENKHVITKTVPVRSLLALALALWQPSAFATDNPKDESLPGTPSVLTAEDRADPIGADDPTPEFSWLPQDTRRNAIQTAYQIVVASRPELLSPGKADLWDSGQTENSNSAFISYQGRPLASRQACWWAVRTADGRGEWSPWSAPARFEMGLLANEDWTGAQWIWADDDNLELPQSYYFRKLIKVPDKPIIRARAYVSSVHHHVLYVDDKLYGRGQAFENPEYQYYQTFDITPYLQPGRTQVLGARCHWFKGGQGRPESKPGFLFKAVIEFEDGEMMTVGTDDQWKSRCAEWYYPAGKGWRRGEAGPYEYIDGRRYPQGWNLLDYDDSGWSGVVRFGPQPTKPWVNLLTAQETVIETYEMAPLNIRQQRDSTYLADFGKIYAGHPKIHFSGGEPGAKMIIKCDYRTERDGTIDGKDQSCNLNYEYILRGGEETFEPFWYHGLRYISVEPGKETVQEGGKMKILREYTLPSGFDGSSISVVVRHNRVDPKRSSFECSDSMINAVWDLCKRSARQGSQEGFLDTPTREQGQFTHDGYQTSLASMKCFGERDLTQAALRQFAHSQEKYWPDGQVNAVYPNEDGKRQIRDWTQSWVMWAYDYYMQTGDLELIGDLFDHLVKTGEFNKRSENKTSGLVDWGSCDMEAGWKSYHTGIVDWPERYGYDLTTSQRAVLSCNAYQNYMQIAEMARALGRPEEAKRFTGYAVAIRQAIQKRLWNEKKHAYVDGLYADGSQSTNTSQQANMVPLALGFTEGRPDMTQGAMDLVISKGFSTAPMIVRYLIRAYGEHGEGEALRKYLTDTNGQNWAHIIADGGTFTWESWFGKTSQSHPVSSYAGVIACQDYILGVQPLEAGYDRVKVKPLTCGLTYAKGVIPTQRGPLGVSWKNAKIFSMTVDIPCNVRADVYIPKGEAGGADIEVDGRKVSAEAAGNYLRVRDVGSGKHRFIR